MSLSKINSFMGYVFMLIGAAKAILIIMIFSKMTISLSLLFSGLDLTELYYPLFCWRIKFFEMVFGIIAIILIVPNYLYQEKLIKPYAATVGAWFVDFITPSILAIIVIFFICCIYFKAGNTILRLNTDPGEKKRKNKKLAKRTASFYNGIGNKKMTNQEKIEAFRTEIKSEMQEWKELLDSGEIDLESYNQEIDRLEKKAQKNNINLKNC